MSAATGRIEAAFDRLKAERRTGLVAYLTAGYPDIDSTLRLVPALLEGGADIIELGVPFSDPLADGATIQRATFRALQKGVTPAVCLDVVRRLRAGGAKAPLILMGYYNPLLAYGLEPFVRDAAGAQAADDVEADGGGDSGLEGAEGRALNGGAVGKGIGEGDAELDDVGAAFEESGDEPEGGVDVRVAGGEVGDEAGAALRLEAVEGSFDAAAGSAHAANPAM